MIRVLVADDHAVVREGLKHILDEASDVSVAGEAGDGQEVLSLIRQEDFDVVVLDITMPGRSGLDVLNELKSRNRDLPVLILSVHPEEQYAVRVLKAGASGYLTKNSAADELVQAVRAAARGEKYVSASLAQRLALDLEKPSGKPLHETLSDREYEVMRMIAEGMTVTEIARKLSLSLKTVSTYRSRVLDKMNMKTNVEIARYAVKSGLVD
jgi:DNA-binding NarL/FixJ family response regulator